MPKILSITDYATELNCDKYAVHKTCLLFFQMLFRNVFGLMEFVTFLGGGKLYIQYKEEYIESNITKIIDANFCFLICFF